jgi:hypothetical protein
MYCTISEPEPSTGSLSFDARRSYEALGRNAELLGSLSASFTREAREAADAYRDALGASTSDAWARFVAAADTLARHTESIDSVVQLDEREREAYVFFDRIARENADLLTPQVPALAG